MKRPSIIVSGRIQPSGARGRNGAVSDPSAGPRSRLPSRLHHPHFADTLRLPVPPDGGETKEPASATSRINAVILRYRPAIERVVLEELVNIAENRLQDDVLIAGLFNKTYALLPAPVRKVLSREKCLYWLMQNRTPLLLKLADHRTTRPEPSTSALSREYPDQ